MTTMSFDPLMFGQRLKHARRRAGLTLEQLGAKVGRPAPYLSLVENGKREPKLSLITSMADVLDTSTADLLASDPPSRRAQLEMEVIKAQDDPLYQAMGLPHLKPGARLPDVALEHLTTLFRELRASTLATATSAEIARQANVTLRHELEAADNYLPDIEQVAAEALAAVGYDAAGAVPQRVLTDLAAHFGFTVHQDAEIPESLQSVTDLRQHRIYIAQRDALRTREARTVVLRTLGHFVLGHADPIDYEQFLRQRIHANYFARAILLPEFAAVAALQEAKEYRDIAIEDLKELFYVGYSMAAHRFANLITHHLGIRTHYLRGDREGTIWRGWSNDGIPMPVDADGVIIGQRLCREWAGRSVFRSSQRFGLLHQFVDTPGGTYFEVSHVEVDDNRHHSVTVGTDFDGSRFFRGRDTDAHTESTCPDPACCRQPSAELSARWEGRVWPSVHEQPALLSVTPSSANSGVDLPAIYEFLEHRTLD